MKLRSTGWSNKIDSYYKRKIYARLLTPCMWNYLYAVEILNRSRKRRIFQCYKIFFWKFCFGVIIQIMNYMHPTFSDLSSIRITLFLFVQPPPLAAWPPGWMGKQWGMGMAQTHLIGESHICRKNNAFIVFSYSVKRKPMSTPNSPTRDR